MKNFRKTPIGFSFDITQARFHVTLPVSAGWAGNPTLCGGLREEQEPRWGVNPMANFRSSPHTAGPRAASATSCSWRGGVWAGFVPFCNRDLQRRGRGAGARGVPEVTERAAHRERGQGWGWGRRPRAERLQGKAQKAAAPRGPAGAAGSTTTSPVSLVPFFLPLAHAAEAAADFPRGSSPASRGLRAKPQGRYFSCIPN